MTAWIQTSDRAVPALAEVSLAAIGLLTVARIYQAEYRLDGWISRTSLQRIRFEAPAELGDLMAELVAAGLAAKVERHGLPGWEMTP